MRKSLVILLVFVLLLTGCGESKVDEKPDDQESVTDENLDDKESVVDENSDDQESVVLPKYRIVEVEEIHTPQAQRYAYQVVVDEQASKEQLAGIADEVIKIAKDETPFNALVVFFNDKDAFAGLGMTLGKVEHAPSGDWSKAMEVDTGDYDKMQTIYSLYEKDWSQQLTDEEANIYREWQDEYQRRAEKEDLPEEKEITDLIAEKHGLTSEEVDAVFNKHISWAFQDGQD